LSLTACTDAITKGFYSPTMPVSPGLPPELDELNDKEHDFSSLISLIWMQASYARIQDLAEYKNSTQSSGYYMVEHPNVRNVLSLESSPRLGLW